MDTEEIIRLIKESKKSTQTRAFVSGNLRGLDWKGAKFVGGGEFGVLSGDFEVVQALLQKHAPHLTASEVEVTNRNSAVPLADLTRYEARI